MSYELINRLVSLIKLRLRSPMADYLNRRPLAAISNFSKPLPQRCPNSNFKARPLLHLIAFLLLRHLVLLSLLLFSPILYSQAASESVEKISRSCLWGHCQTERCWPTSTSGAGSNDCCHHLFPKAISQPVSHHICLWHFCFSNLLNLASNNAPER